MTPKTIDKISFLIIGLLLSSVVGISFRLSEGFEYHGMWFTLNLSILDIAVMKSSEVLLSSRLVGYLFYLFFGFMCLLSGPDVPKPSRWAVLVFFGLIGLASFAELYSYYLDFAGLYTGVHVRVGLSVFLLGLFMLYEQRKIEPAFVSSEKIDNKR